MVRGVESQIYTMQNLTSKLNNYEKINHNVVFASEQCDTTYWNSLFVVKLF